jgi:hypothetical protein
MHEATSRPETNMPFLKILTFVYCDNLRLAGTLFKLLKKFYQRKYEKIITRGEPCVFQFIFIDTFIMQREK